MTLDHWRFGFWTVVLLAAAVVVVLYQHATHTNLILGMLGGSGTGPVEGAVPNLSSNPNMYGAMSRASGQWTPLGPTNGTSAFPYNPPQPGIQ